jgi:hypothetical protein
MKHIDRNAAAALRKEQLKVHKQKEVLKEADTYGRALKKAFKGIYTVKTRKALFLTGEGNMKDGR